MKTKIVDLESEYIKMKNNNRSLAKALAEQQQISKKYLDENNVLQKKLYMSSSLNMQYKKTLNVLLKSFKESFNNCIELTNNLSNMLILCKEGADLQDTIDSDNYKNDLYKSSLRSSSPLSQKTQAVKPMVSGHVIHHPIINLSRLTETRITDNHQSSQTETSIENHSTTNDLMNIMPGPNLPIRRLIPQLDIEDETDESIEDDSLVIENENNMNSHPNHRSLEPVVEYSDEENISFNNIYKEVRIVLEPLHLNHINNNQNHIPEEPKRKRIIEDPLEGTSTMLDNSGNLLDCNHYKSKPRQASKRAYFYESDSEESNFASDRKIKRWITKRKTSTEKKDITGQKYKVKRNRSTGDSSSYSSNSPSEDNVVNISHGESDRRSRRSASKSLAEPSLKKKLRR